MATVTPCTTSFLLFSQTHNSSSSPNFPTTPSPHLRSHSKSLALTSTPIGAASTVEAIVSPSLANANIMFFKSGYNVQIMVDEGEPEEVLLRRFRREVSKAGVIPETKRRRYFENSQEEKKRRTRDAAKKNRKRRWAPRIPTPTAGDPALPKKVEDDDNWEMPEGGLPY
ncbi:hypothetical protein IFM89_027754 [Coptis chinensis]|uniref:30S ribosomal protein S21, chloroplastic n=1 Tax=Coptis chinensis TaxID=261450 RepID=A0A835HTK9_9MAGN|nr:hypothetical protein IFM89_027754 [Coptis chinensis]